MASGEFFERIKPYGFGFGGGLIVGVIAVFATGWGVTASTMAEAVEEARVQPMASLCAAEAEHAWQAQGKKLEDISGWTNREAREELVTTTMEQWAIPDELKAEVIDACASELA